MLKITYYLCFQSFLFKSHYMWLYILSDNSNVYGLGWFLLILLPCMIFYCECPCDSLCRIWLMSKLKLNSSKIIICFCQSPNAVLFHLSRTNSSFEVFFWFFFFIINWRLTYACMFSRTFLPCFSHISVSRGKFPLCFLHLSLSHISFV
jgi:hypothetical protein